MAKGLNPKDATRPGFLFFFILLGLVIFLSLPSALCAWSEVPRSVLTNTDPLAITFNNTLYLFAVGADGKIYFNTFAFLWSDWALVRDAEMRDSGPTNNIAATVYSDGRLYLFQETAGYLIRVISTDGRAWSTWWDLPASANATGPAATVFNGNSYLFVRAAGEDTIRYTASHHTAERRWVVVNPGTDRAQSRLAAVVFNNALYVLYRGLDNGIYYTRSADGAVWSGSVRINPATDWTGSGPTAVVLDGKLHVIYRGLNNQLYLTTSADGTSWGPSVEVPPGGALTDRAPTASVFNVNSQLYIFRKGFASDGRLYFTRLCAPSRIDSFTPNRGRRGDLLRYASINGANLQSGNLSSSCNITFLNLRRVGPSLMLVDLDLENATVGPCTITLATGCSPPTSGQFIVDPPPPCSPPFVEGISPFRGRREQTIENVTISGSNLRGGTLSSNCDIVFENVRNTNPRALIANFNLTAAGTGPCTVWVDTGCAPPASSQFIVDPPPCAPPTLAGINPDRARRGERLANVEINGSNLAGGNLASSCGIVFESVRNSDPNRIVADFSLQEAAVGPCTVEVNTGCSPTASVPFTVEAPSLVRIDAFDPEAIIAGINTVVTLRGTDLLGTDDLAQVTTDNDSLRVEVLPDSSLTEMKARFVFVRTPLAGETQVTVTNDRGVSNAARLNVVTRPAEVPQIDSVSPGFMFRGRSQDFTIRGAGFSSAMVTLPAATSVGISFRLRTITENTIALTITADPQTPENFYSINVCKQVLGREVCDSVSFQVRRSTLLIAASIRKIISSGADLDFENLPTACPTAPCPPNPRIAVLVPGASYKVTFGGLNLQDLAVTGSHPGITFSATERDPIGTLVTGVLEVDETAPDGEHRIHVQNNFGSDYFRVLIRTGSGVDASIESLDEKPEWIQALADREIVTMETLNTFQSAGGSDLESTISTEGALRCIASPDVVLNYNLIVARALFSYTLFDCPRDPEPLRQVCLRAIRGVEDQLNLRVRTFGANVFFGVRIQVGFRIQVLQIGPFAFQFLIPVCVPRVGGYFIGMDVNGLFEVRLDSGDRRRNVFQWRINPPVVLGFNPPTAFSYINPGTGEEIPACQRPCRTTDPGQQPVKPCACPDIPGQLVGPNREPIFVVVVTEPRSAEQWPEITARIPVHSALINVNVNLNSRARVNVSRLGIELAQPARGADFPISAGPANPTVNALARIRGITPDPTSETNFTWSTLLRLQLTRSRVSEVTLPPQTVRGGAFTPNWNSIGIRGGVLLLRTEATADGQPLRAETRGVTVHGTNPGATAINDHINGVLKGAPASHIFTASQIACWENGRKQFDADREGGIGWPSINPGSGATGIMQLLDPRASDEAVWNWQANIEEGVSTLADKRAEARNHHIGERTRLNQERGPGNHCPAGVPPPLSDQRMPGTPWAVVSQLERETIRRYNCGREHRWEPRDAPNCAGSWVVRPYLSRAECDRNYVERVLNCR